MENYTIPSTFSVSFEIKRHYHLEKEGYCNQTSTRSEKVPCFSLPSFPHHFHISGNLISDKYYDNFTPFLSLFHPYQFSLQKNWCLCYPELKSVIFSNIRNKISYKKQSTMASTHFGEISFLGLVSFGKFKVY